jgi:lysophospholipase L1-like esterase
VEVVPAKTTQGIVAFGDSITDGFKSTNNANQRWPDIFAERLRTAGKQMAVVNQGISGNRILNDSLTPQMRFGPNALSRFDRDVLTMSGVSHVVVLIGINDIGMGNPARNAAQAVSADDIIAAYRQLIARARAKGLKVIGATLLPFRGAGYFHDEGEAKRQVVNEWIRTSKEYDGVIDFDRATRDPAKPDQMLAEFDSGDHLHPNDAGYRAMANAVDLKLFE